jgi:hypothetical protein
MALIERTDVRGRVHLPVAAAVAFAFVATAAARKSRLRKGGRHRRYALDKDTTPARVEVSES